MSLLEFLLTNAMTGRWIFMTTESDVPEWWFYDFAAHIAKRGAVLVVQVGCS